MADVVLRGRAETPGESGENGRQSQVQTPAGAFPSLEIEVLEDLGQPAAFSREFVEGFLTGAGVVFATAGFLVIVATAASTT